MFRDGCSDLWMEMDEPDCDEYREFRSFSGFCNNDDRPFWGNSTQPYARMSQRRYHDGKYTAAQLFFTFSATFRVSRRSSQKIAGSDSSISVTTSSAHEWSQLRCLFPVPSFRCLYPILKIFCELHCNDFSGRSPPA